MGHGCDHPHRVRPVLRALTLGKARFQIYPAAISNLTPSPITAVKVPSGAGLCAPLLRSLLLLLCCLGLRLDTLARPYIVKAGDSLERIAQRELGQAKRWPEIAQASKLSPPYALKIGQRLELPDNLAVQHPTILTPLPPLPPRVTNAPTPSLSPVTPGNTIPTNQPPPKTSPLPIHDSNGVNGNNIWWVLPLALLVSLLFEALNLRISCWFSLVETSFFRCFKLAVYLLILGIVSFFAGLLLLLIGGAIGIAAKTEPWSMAAVFLTIPIALATWFILSLFVIKHTLDCKWRSVVTLLIMSWFVTWTLGIILALSTMSLGPIIDQFNKLPKP